MGQGYPCLPFPNGSGGHRSALSHTTPMAGAGQSQTPFHLTSPSPCSQEITINIPSLQLLIEYIWPDLVPLLGLQLYKPREPVLGIFVFLPTYPNKASKSLDFFFYYYFLKHKPYLP